VHTFPTDDGDVAMKCPTEIAIPDRRENELSNLGFLPLLYCKHRDFAVIIGAQAFQEPKVYFDEAANGNAQQSSGSVPGEPHNGGPLPTGPFMLGPLFMGRPRSCPRK
jgi:predicted component of type VI protein secretion system